jgi:ATP-binding cassette subfamily B (MDR/TAP) protein 1
MLFSSIIYKHVSWFDSKDKAPGVLSNILSEDISLLNGLSSETTSIIMESIMTIVLGLAIALYFSWRMALITFALIPLVILGGYMSMKLTAKAKGLAAPTSSGNVGGTIDYYKESNALLSDVIMNYRTVISFGPKNVAYLMKKYNDLLMVPNKIAVSAAH